MGEWGRALRGGDAVCVEGEVVVCYQTDLGAFDCGVAGEVEVAVVVGVSVQRNVLGERAEYVRVVGHVDDSLVCPLEELGLILNRQDCLTLGRLPSSVHHARLDGTRESLIAVFAADLEHHTLPAFFDAIIQAGNVLLDTHGGRSFPDLFAPSFCSAVEVIRPVVGAELVGLSVVERSDGRVLGAVRDTADGGAKVGAIVGFVVGLSGEALDDVRARDVERLEDCAEGEEGDLIRRHIG